MYHARAYTNNSLPLYAYINIEFNVFIIYIIKYHFIVNYISIVFGEKPLFKVISEGTVCVYLLSYSALPQRVA